MKRTFMKKVLALSCAVVLCIGCAITASAATIWSDGSMNTTQYSPGTKKGNSYAIQTIIKRLGYNPGTVDGYFGDNTKSAVKKYQTNNGLTSDGIVGLGTWTELGGELTGTTTRNILRNSDSVDIGVYDTYKVSGSSTTTDCIFKSIGIYPNSRYNNKWLTDNSYTGRGTSGSFTLSSNAMVMNSNYTVNAYPAQ